MVTLLIARGADKSLRDTRGATPEDTAIGKGFLEIGALLKP